MMACGIIPSVQPAKPSPGVAAFVRS
jgi:hypothetical protein